MTWIITGGAGYIGSHVIRQLKAQGLSVVVYDDLSTGHRKFVPNTVLLHQAALNDSDALQDVLEGADGVVHLAGYKVVGESFKRPVHVYEQNVAGTLNLLKAMKATGVKNLVFASSSSVYGGSRFGHIDEASDVPASPYGRSKLMCEQIIEDCVDAHDLNAISLRIFNPVGSGYTELHDDSPHHLFPVLINTLRKGGTPSILGDTFNTEDGTAVRDFVHVSDVAVGIGSAVSCLMEGKNHDPFYNLGTGVGTSVCQIMDMFAAVTGIDFTPTILPKRQGDPDKVIANIYRTQRDFNWTPWYTLENMVEDTWYAEH